MIFSIAIGAKYLSYVKSIATFALTFFAYIISVLASVLTKQTNSTFVCLGIYLFGYVCFEQQIAYLQGTTYLHVNLSDW